MSNIEELVKMLRVTTERMANVCSVDMETWNEHSNAALSCADALEAQAAERDSLRKALDDRWAADLKAAKAIFAESSRTHGFPSVREVVGWYVAEVERLENALKQAEDDNAFNFEAAQKECGQRLAVEADRDSLRAKLDRAKEALAPFADERNDGGHLWNATASDFARARTVFAELSADAPAQPPQISDAVRPLLDEAIAALEKIDKFEISGLYSMVNHVFRLKNIARNALGRIR